MDTTANRIISNSERAFGIEPGSRDQITSNELKNRTEFKSASSIMKCNTWENRKGNVILSVYGKTI